jgi:hypothetical protein
MITLLDENIKESIIQRVNSLKQHDNALWGTMNAEEMVCHIADPLRVAAGIKSVDFTGNKMTTTVVKWLVLTVLQIPKGKIQTSREFKQGVAGTRPKSIEKDKETFISLLNNFEKSFESNPFPVHPSFGKMSKWQWARISYLHIDHHLRQFGR